ncbi:MAG: hypothetical protein ACQEQI_08830 [Bacillota bacterium]
MKNKIISICIVMLILPLLAGCLVKDQSTSMMSNEDKSEVKTKARQLTDDFFKYNTYDQDTNNSYNAQELLDLFKEDLTGDVVIIDPIMGGDYGKSFATLKSELNRKETLFEAFEAQLTNLDYDSYKLTFDYEIVFIEDNIDSYTARYSAKFQVFEEIDGEKIPTPSGVPEGVTDNGIITFELTNESRGWKIERMEVDFREIGEISL